MTDDVTAPHPAPLTFAEAMSYLRDHPAVCDHVTDLVGVTDHRHRADIPQTTSNAALLAAAAVAGDLPDAVRTDQHRTLIRHAALHRRIGPFLDELYQAYLAVGDHEYTGPRTWRTVDVFHGGALVYTCVDDEDDEVAHLYVPADWITAWAATSLPTAGAPATG